MDDLSAGPAPPDTNVEELRDAPRFSLIIRSAKLVCESGEYLCVVRDISATGCKLRLFHEAPPEKHVFLELANGDRYAMERMWAADSHAGYRIAQPIDVNEFVVEPSPFPKRPIRLRLERAATVIAGASISPATLRDLSQKGGRIEAPCHIAVDPQIRLEVDGMRQVYAKVRWRRQNVYGLVLDDTFRLDELACLAFQLQPPQPKPAGEIAAPPPEANCA
jgi:hypothetical protein